MKVSEILRSGVIRELQQRGVDSGPSLQLMADGVIAKMQQGVDGTLNVDGVGLGQFLDGALAGGEAGAVAGAGGRHKTPTRRQQARVATPAGRSSQNLALRRQSTIRRWPSSGLTRTRKASARR